MDTKTVLPLPRATAARLVFVSLLYFAAARCGWIFAAAPTGVSPFWPPAGLALALMILWGPRIWPGIFLGALAADAWAGVTGPVLAVGAIANTVEALLGGALLARWPPTRWTFDRRLERLRDVATLLAAGVVAAGVGALVGTIGLWLTVAWGRPLGAFLARAGTWWLGDAMGVLVLTPPILLWIRLPRLLPWRRTVEAIALAGALTVSSYLSFGPLNPWSASHSAIEYLPFPLVIWAAMRFGVRGASAASLLLTMAAIWHYAISPLERAQIGADALLLLVQTSVAVIVLTALVIGVVTTERDAATRALAESQLKLQQAQKLESLGLLAGGIAHDFNNLLTGVLGSANLARQQLVGHPVDLHLAEIEQSAERAADFCRQMLAYAGQGRVLAQPVDLSAVVRDTAQPIARSFGSSVTLSLDLPPHLPAVDADATQLRQLVVNLLLNASEAIGDRGGTIRVSTSVVIADRTLLATSYLAPDLPAGRYVLLSCADTGHGMPDETLARIFDPFFSTRFTGRGLGLAAVLGIVRGHRGALWVTSREGLGTTFRLLLPATTAPAVAPATRADHAAWRTTGTALIVDDEASVRAVATRMLATCGLASLTAADGEEAVTLLRAHRGQVALVLLDLTMPVMDGEETHRRMREVDPVVPVLLMSGYAEQEASTRFQGLPPAGFVQKPFRLEDLREAVRVALQREPASDPMSRPVSKPMSPSMPR